MSKNDVEMMDVNDNKFLSLTKNILETEVLNSVLKSLHRSIEFCEYSKEEVNWSEIVCILRKLNDDFNVKIYDTLDEIENLESEIGKIEKESKEDKKRFARVAYAFINNGEIERAKKELEKIIAE